MLAYIPSNRCHIATSSWSHTLMEIKKYFYSHSPPSADSRRIGVSYKRKYAHEILVNHLVKLCQGKSVARFNMTIAVD